MMRTAFAVLLGLVLSATVLVAQLGTGDSDADPRVRDLLMKTELKYTVDSDGDYKLIMDTGGGRTQLVFINSSTETLDPFEIREIWAPAYRSDGLFSKEVANDLLLDSFQKKLGAWQTMKSGESYVAVFAAKVAAEIDPDSLERIVASIASSADEMEEKITEKDEF